jgi:Rps23 Pro-64 3,4-dihydroxylase Tpa1-like proline 4-hydroxylase
MLESHREYIKYRQKQLKERIQRAAEEEAEEEAARVAKQEEIAERKKLLLEQQEDERLRQKYIQRKEKLAEQKWNSQLDTLIAQIRGRLPKDDKLEEIRDYNPKS